MRSLRIPVPLIGPSSQGRSLTQNVERTINFYPEASVANANAPVALLGCPGRDLVGTEFTYSGGFSPVRGWTVLDGRLFLAEARSLREWSSDDTSEVVAPLATTTGRVVMSSNTGKLVLGDGAFKVYDPATSAFETVTIDGEEALTGTWSGFLNQQTLYLQRNSQRVYYSDVSVALTVQGTSYFEAEISPDEANCLLVDRQEVYVGGARSIQVFHNSGDADNPFEPVPGGMIPVGVVAPYSFLPFDNGLVLVGVSDDGAGRVLRLDGPGSSPKRISTHAVEKAIEETLRDGDANTITAYTYEEEGHLFYVLNLPGPDVNTSPGITWAYDAATGEWAERGIFSILDGQWHRERDELHAYVFGKHYTSDYKKGQVYTKSLDTLTQALHPNPKTRVFPIDTQGKTVSLDKLEIEMTKGVGLDGTGQGTDPQMMVRISEDGGRRWGNEMHVSIGQIGDTDCRVELTRLGRSNNFAVWLSVSDPVRVELNRAWAHIRG